MKNLYYENQGTNTYLVYKIGKQDVVDSMSLGMLTNNKISGLTQTIFTQMDDEKILKFNVSAKVSVSQFFSGVVNKKRLIGVFSGIVSAMLSAEEYMLDEQAILLDMDYIFTDVSTCDTVLVCLPIVDMKQEKTDLGLFFRNIMFSTQFDQTENCDHVAKIINYLNSNGQFCLTDFKGLLDEIEGKKVKSVQDDNKIESKSRVVSSEPQKVQNVQKINPNLVAMNAPKTTGASPLSKGTGMVRPPQMNQSSTGATVQSTGSEKEISFMYLMQHYNKENAALYKAQKNAKKAQKQQKKNPSANNVPNNNFSVPGQTPKLQNPSGTNFAVPGQVPPGPGNNFAIPGQVAPLPASKVNIQQETPKQVAMPVGGAQKGMVQPGIQPNMAQPGIQSNMAQPGMQPNMVQPGMQPNMVQPGMQPNMMNQAPVNFGETSVLGSNTIGQTTVLNSAQLGAPVMKPYLVRKKNDEKIMIDKPVFRIGKEKSYVDYFISDNTAISRSHANIISRENEYYIIDTNSTNHTYINGTMIGSNSEMKLTNGDKVRLANEEFEFKFF